MIDVGINRTEAGLVGDVDFEAVKQVAGWITPVPGGVGLLTVAMLLGNTLAAARLQVSGSDAPSDEFAYLANLLALLGRGLSVYTSPPLESRPFGETLTRKLYQAVCAVVEQGGSRDRILFGDLAAAVLLDGLGPQSICGTATGVR